MTRKRYNLPQGISSEITHAVDQVKNNIGTLNYKIVPLSAIEFDPDNPRALAITRDDLPQGPQLSDPLYKKKQQEFDALKQTAETIKKYGVRNAVEIYKYGNTYRLIHGERRCLSSILADKKDIPAKVLDEKPNNFDIRLLQLIENVQREDLNLFETLNNIQQVIREYKNHVDANVSVDSAFLESLINRSKTHCLNFMAVLNGPEDLLNAIKATEINSLEKAAIIAKAKSSSHRSSLLQACLDGASLKQLKHKVIQYKNIDRLSTKTIVTNRKRPGKQPKKVTLGSTRSRGVVSKLVQLVAMDPLYEKFRNQLKAMSFEDYSSCSNAFSSLLQIMEKVEL